MKRSIKSEGGAVPEKKPKSTKFEKKSKPLTGDKKGAPKKLSKKPGAPLTEKPEDWNEFKKKKKELKLKRKQTKDGFDVIVEAKKLGERLRRKTMKGGDSERTALIDELHTLLKGTGHYAKFVLAHDTSRIVQWLLKYSGANVKKEISEEMIPLTCEMLQSKYGIFCIKRLLKYGDSAVRASIIDKLYGHAVKLASHSISSPVFEYAYSTWATPLQKQHLIQEFYGDLYKNSKDDKIKHLRDVFQQSPDLKSATLSATKANLVRILDKNLLDSGLVQSVLCQFLSECNEEDRIETISALVSHIVVISNSKDGARAAMECIWHGTNKDRKLAMKTLKEHVIELAKHEYGHCAVIALLDTADDTVLLHKIILGEILKNARELAVSDWGRKVLLWLVAPAEPTCFHPVFVKELEEGRKASNSKKAVETRRAEILTYSSKVLLQLVAEEPAFWLANSSLAYELLAILKAGEGGAAKAAYENIAGVVGQPDWTVKVKEVETSGVEDPGLHMILKKLLKHDQERKSQEGYVGFGECLAHALKDKTVETWVGLNRGCFLLVAIYENGTEETQALLVEKLEKHKKSLGKQKTTGAKILLKKLSK